LSARRLALTAFSLLALYELAEVVALSWIRADAERVETVGAWFGLDPDTELARLTILIPVALVLGAIDWLVLFGVSRRIGGAVRWRRTAFILSELYALWALAQLALLPGLGPPGALWLLGSGLGVGALAALGYFSAGRAMAAAADGSPPAFVVHDPAYPVERSPSGLEWQDVELGKGPLASVGRTALVHYTGWLTNGRKFDSSVDRGKPFEFRVGAGRVIRGWDEGVATMRQGGRRRLIVPPPLGYGATGAGAIPGGATLVFEVELVDVR
jgi:hypothetical protein